MNLNEIANGNTSNQHEYTDIIKRREYIKKLKMIELNQIKKPFTLFSKTENPFDKTR